MQSIHRKRSSHVEGFTIEYNRRIIASATIDGELVAGNSCVVVAFKVRNISRVLLVVFSCLKQVGEGTVGNGQTGIVIDRCGVAIIEGAVHNGSIPIGRAINAFEHLPAPAFHQHVRE